MNPFNLNGVEFLTLFAALFVVAALAAWFLRWALRAPNDDPDFDLDKLKPYQVAYLQGGTHAVLSAAVASLVQEGAVDINASDGTIAATGFGNKTHDGVEEIALTSVKSVSDLRKGNWVTEESIVEIRGA
ncbi:MAG: TIGR04222 domain-containing membrane protein, partial [Planctomycetaceae bacterium]